MCIRDRRQRSFSFSSLSPLSEKPLAGPAEGQRREVLTPRALPRDLELVLIAIGIRDRYLCAVVRVDLPGLALLNETGLIEDARHFWVLGRSAARDRRH